MYANRTHVTLAMEGQCALCTSQAIPIVIHTPQQRLCWKSRGAAPVAQHTCDVMTTCIWSSHMGHRSPSHCVTTQWDEAAIRPPAGSHTHVIMPASLGDGQVTDDPRQHGGGRDGLVADDPARKGGFRRLRPPAPVCARGFRGLLNPVVLCVDGAGGAPAEMGAG